MADGRRRTKGGQVPPSPKQGFLTHFRRFRQKGTGTSVPKVGVFDTFSSFSAKGVRYLRPHGRTCKQAAFRLNPTRTPPVYGDIDLIVFISHLCVGLSPQFIKHLRKLSVHLLVLELTCADLLVATTTILEHKTADIHCRCAVENAVSACG